LPSFPPTQSVWFLPCARPAFAPAIAVLPWVCQEMTRFLGTVVDAAIGWLVQSILGSFFTGKMEAWIHEIGLAKDVEKLKFEMRNVEMVLAAAEGRKIDNKPLARSLEDLKELLYDSEDIMDEIDFYRLQQQIEQGVSHSSLIHLLPALYWYFCVHYLSCSLLCDQEQLNIIGNQIISGLIVVSFQ
jgi:hypothetical protein